MNAPSAARVARLLATQPGRFSGVHLRAQPGPLRDAWLAGLRGALPAGTPWLRIPPSAPVESVSGGLDLAATLGAGRPVWAPGLAERAADGFLLLSQAQRATPQLLAFLRQLLDSRRLRIEREALLHDRPLALCLVVLDEGRAEDEAIAPLLLDLLPFHLDDAALKAWQDASAAEDGAALDTAPAGAAASDDGAADPVDADVAAALLCEGACRLGIASLRAPSQALAVARALAGLRSADSLAAADLAEAAALVYPARVTRVPADDADGEDAQQADGSDGEEADDRQASDARDDHGAGQSPQAAEPPPGPEGPPADVPGRLPDTLESQLVEMVCSVMPEALLARLRLGPAAGASGRVDAARLRRRSATRHGRPLGSEPGDPRSGRPLDLAATLRAALPWQKLRAAAPDRRTLLAIRGTDLRVRVLRPRTRTTAVFAVDASGSAALHRLNEAKGAVSALLAQCYVRRDQVALLSFRGSGAEQLLPPTRSLARVHRELAAMPGGGGTPLAAGIAAAGQLAAGLRRRGESALVVMLTDGRANVARDGSGGRARAAEQAHAEALAFRSSGTPALLVDISPQPQERARSLAGAMGAEYLALPASGPGALAGAVAQRMQERGNRHD